MSSVVGLDLSLVRTGVALWRDGQVGGAHVGHGSVDAKNRTHRIRRVTSQARAVLDLVDVARDAGPIDLIPIEDYLVRGRGYASDADIIQLHGFVLDQIVAWKIPYAYVHNKTLKAFATGKADADKKAMCAAARQWCTPINHDQADACWLAGFGAFRLGDQMPFPATDWRVAGLTKVSWPDSLGVAA